jgi:hypothetical protein
MTSLQAWPATRAIPIAFGLEMLAPAALAPVLTRTTFPHPAAFGVALALACAAAVLLGGSRAVAHAAVTLTAEHPLDADRANEPYLPPTSFP